jgi:hypothetical protein
VTGIVCAPAVNTVGNATTTIASTLNPDILLYLLESRQPGTNSLMRRSPRQPHTYQKAKDVFSASETSKTSALKVVYKKEALSSTLMMR